MRRDPRELEDRELELIYVAGKLEEAQGLERALDEAGIDYVIRVEQYRAGVIFASVRAGAFFYVLAEAAGACRDILRGLGYRLPDLGG